MPTGTKIVTGVALLLLTLGAAHASAETPIADGAVVTVNTVGAAAAYPVLTRGSVVFINAQRFVVTREPLPAARIADAPPARQVSTDKRPTAPQSGAVWVAGHWFYGPTGFSWVSGRYVTPRVGHVFVPPRWASLEGEHFFFNGFFVPRNVYVRSHFNRYYYSGPPHNRSGSIAGPYWPVGAPTRANSGLTSANVRDPYWPIGVRR
jgi:hypothetical protein